MEEAAHKIVQQLSRKDVAVRAEHSLSFQPLELKYLMHQSCATTKLDGVKDEATSRSSNGYDGYFKPHFTYCGEVPDLITKASKSLEDRHITDQKNKNMPAIGKNRDIIRSQGSVNDVHGSSSSSSGSMGLGSSTFSSARARSSLIHRPTGTSAFSNSGQRQASKMTVLDIHMMQSAQSAALSGSSASLEGSGSLSNKRKLISGASTFLRCTSSIYFSLHPFIWTSKSDNNNKGNYNDKNNGSAIRRSAFIKNRHISMFILFNFCMT